MSKTTIITCCLAAAILLATCLNVQAAENSGEARDRVLRQRSVDLNLGDANGHSTILYNQAKSAGPIDTVLAHENVAGIREALQSGRRDLAVLELQAMASKDAKQASVYGEIHRLYDLSDKTLQSLDAELAKLPIDNAKIQALTREIVGTLGKARKELVKLGSRPLAEPAKE